MNHDSWWSMLQDRMMRAKSEVRSRESRARIEVAIIIMVTMIINHDHSDIIMIMNIINIIRLKSEQQWGMQSGQPAVDLRLQQGYRWSSLEWLSWDIIGYHNNVILLLLFWIFPPGHQQGWIHIGMNARKWGQVIVRFPNSQEGRGTWLDTRQVNPKWEESQWKWKWQKWLCWH